MRKDIALIMAVVFGFFAMNPGLALALPSGYQVEAGEASFDASQANTLVITASNRAVINFDSFSVAQNEIVQFVQPFNSASVLSRVTGGSQSDIYGSLLANGQLVLVNPNGIYFAPSANVQVASLIASTLDIQNAMYLDGQLSFEKKFGFDPASIVNDADITVAPGGHIALLSEAIENRGRLAAELGSVVLGAGEKMTLSFDGQGLINLVIDKGLSGQLERVPLVNSGALEADGGLVLLSAKTLDEALGVIVNNTGVIEANSVVERNGLIELVVDEGSGIVRNSGTIRAVGDDIGETGGTVHLLGEKVGLFGGEINVSGDTGGGTVLIGGDYKGSGFVRNASRTYVGPDSLIYADALTTGDGGKVIVWSDDTTRFYGSVLARGGAQSGDGGFIEISSKNYLDYHGFVDASAANGTGGNILFDPLNIVLSILADSNTAGFKATNPGRDLTEAFADDAGLNSNFDVTAGTGSFAGVGNGNTITLQATNNITVSDAFDIATSTGNSNVSLVLQADNDINVNAAVTASGSGTIAMTADNDASGVGALTVSAPVTTADGSLTLSAGGTLTVGSAITTGNSATSGTPSANISLTSTQGSVAINANVTTGNATVADVGASQTATTGSITVSAGTSVTGTGRLITGDASFTGSSGGADTATSGNISVTAGTAGVSGGIGLSNANALTIGLANSGTGAGVDTANTGSITLSARDEINNGTASTPLGVTYGVRTGQDAGTDGILAVTTSQAGGNIFITSASALNLGAFTTTGGSAQTVNVSTTGGANLTVLNAAESLSGDTVTLNSGTGTLTIQDASYTIGAGSLTLTGDAIDLTGGANSVIGTGTILLQPSAAGVSIGVGGGAGTLDISDADIAALADGWSGITIGRSNGTALMTISSSTFTDPVTLRMPGVDGDITLSGPLSTAASNSSITLIAGTGNTGTFTQTAGAGNTIASGSGAVSITADSIVLNTTANTITGTGSILLQPATAGRPMVIGAAGAATDFALSTTEIAALTNGFSGITIGRADGTGGATISAITFNDPVTIRSPLGGTLAVNGQITGAGDASVTLDGSGATTNLSADIVTSGDFISISDNVNLLANVLLDTTSGDPAGNNITIAGTLNGAFNLTVNAGTAGTTSFNGVVGGGMRPVNLTADGNVSLGAALNLSGNLLYNSGVWASGANAIDVDGNVTIAGGTFNAPSSTMNVAGNWSNAATFNASGGTVILDGGNQSLSGSTTFNNFTKADPTNNSTDVTLTFDNTATQTVNGLLTFNGLDADDRVNLVSDSPGTQWGLTANGTFAIDFVDVADSDASGGLTIVHSDAVNGGNTANWGFAERLAITGTASMTAGSTNELTVTATDNYGYTATSYSGIKSLTFSGLSNSFEGSFTPQVEGVNFGTGTNVNFSSGVSATNAATLTAYRAQSASVAVTDGSISTTTSTDLDLTVNPAAADHLKLTGTASMTAGASNELTVTAHDLYGNTATGYAGLKSLTFSGLANALEGGFIPNVEGTNFGTGTNVNFTSGVSDANAATLIAYRAESASVDVTDGTIDSAYDAAHDLDLTVNPAAADHLKLTGASGTMTAGASNELTVTAHDLYGNTATGYAGLKSLTFSGLGNAPDGSIPNVEGVNFGTGTGVNFTSGVSDANAATLIAYLAEGPVPVDVTDGTIDTSFDAAHDLDLTVDFGPAHNLVFLQQPTDANANFIIAPAVTVGVRDQFFNLITTDNATSVGIAIGTNPGGGALAGTTPQTAASGVATFADLSINAGGVGYTLDATSAGLTGATSVPFNIIAPSAPPASSLNSSVVDELVIDSLNPMGGAPVSFEALGREEAGVPSRFFYGGRALYVTTVDGVEIYELSTYELLASFPWRETPSNIFSSNRDGAIYVLMPRSNRILILNSEYPGRRSIHGLNGQPADMALSPDGSVAYVTNSLNDTVQVVDMKKKKVRFALPAGSMPGSAVLSPDGRHLFIANILDHTVSKLDAVTGKVLLSIPAGGVPAALSLSRDGRELYVADSAADKILIFGTANGVLQGEIPTGHSPNAVKPDIEGKMLFVSNRGSDSISFIDLAGRKEIAQVPVGRRPSGMALDPEGGKLYVANELSGDLSVIDVSSHQVVKTVNVGTAPSKLAINQSSEARA